jgi:hypothetical protein
MAATAANASDVIGKCSPELRSRNGSPPHRKARDGEFD